MGRKILFVTTDQQRYDTLGCNGGNVARTPVIDRLAADGIRYGGEAAGWVLAFMLSLDDFVIANFVTGPGATTLPIRIYSEVRLGVRPEINAVCTIMIAVVAVGTVAASLLAKRGALRRERAALGAQV